MVSAIIGGIVGSFMGCWLYALLDDYQYRKRQDKFVQEMCKMAEQMEKDNEGQ